MMIVIYVMVRAVIYKLSYLRSRSYSIVGTRGICRGML